MKVLSTLLLALFASIYSANQTIAQGPGGCQQGRNGSTSPNQTSTYNPAQYLASAYNAQQNYLQQQASLQQQMALMQQQAAYRQQQMSLMAERQEAQRKEAEYQSQLKAEKKKAKVEAAKLAKAKRAEAAKARRAETTETTTLASAKVSRESLSTTTSP